MRGGQEPLSGRPVPRPEGLELLAGAMLGPHEHAEPLPISTGEGVHRALERVLVAALERPPCFVSFSGGRDSSAVLALASAVARRDGLVLPVPATIRFRSAPGSEEAHWQELVLRHLALGRLEVLELGDELDALGPAATDVLRRHGVLWPGNAYMQRPLVELARGGTLLTGIGGDELFSTSAPPRGIAGRLAARLPGPVREANWMRRQAPDGYGWLTAQARTRVMRALAGEELGCPYAWDEALRYWHASRSFAALDGTLGVVAEPWDVAVINPFLHPAVLAELCQAGGATGFASRAAAMHWLCGELLPPEVYQRPTKAQFGAAVWGAASRAFVAEWDGSGLDPADVDIESLRIELRRPEPDFRTILLVHSAWVASSARARPAARE
jgi:asparagine synthase (glutamine-hydrolysing)